MDLLGKLKSLAALPRPDRQKHVAELAVAARLLLMASARLHALADGLLIGDRGLARLHRHAEA